MRVTETAERPVLPFPLPLSGHRARGPELRSGATTGVFSSSAPDPCAIGLPPSQSIIMGDGDFLKFYIAKLPSAVEML